MPPYDPASSDSADPDSDSPEVVSHSSARAQTQRKRAALKSFHAEQKGRAKTRNRERDIQGKKKKEEEEEAQSRAGVTVEDGSDLGHQSGEQSRRLEERMRKAMADANDEEAGSAADDADDDDDDVQMGLADEAELENDSATGDDSAEYGDSDDDSDDSEEQSFITGETTDATITLSTNPNYLPEHLFASLGRRPSSPPPPPPSINAKARSKAHRAARKPRRSGTKDVIVGGRTVRTLNATKPSHPQTLPSARVNKFTKRVLALNKSPAPSAVGSTRLPGRNPRKLWERRAAHLGALRTSTGLVPAAHFAHRS